MTPQQQRVIQMVFDYCIGYWGSPGWLARVQTGKRHA
jgi:hypothetical protein